MKNTIGLIAGVAGVTIGVGMLAYYGKKLHEQKYATIRNDAEGNDIPQEEDESVLESIKKAAAKKVTDILAWVIVNKEKIEAVGTVVGIVGAVLGVVNAIRDFKRADETAEMLHKIWDHCDEFETLWNRAMENQYGMYTDLRMHLVTPKKAAGKGGKK